MVFHPIPTTGLVFHSVKPYHEYEYVQELLVHRKLS